MAEVCLRNLKPKDANGLSENVMEFLRQWTIDAILPTALWAEKAPFSTGFLSSCFDYQISRANRVT